MQGSYLVGDLAGFSEVVIVKVFKPKFPNLSRSKPLSSLLPFLSPFPRLIPKTRARFTNKVKSIIMSLNFSSSQLASISLAEFVSKLILI